MWEEFTRWHAPRGRVRVDVRDDTGQWAHRYDAEQPVTAGAPQGPYAMYLADARGRFRFLAFDLDAKRAEEDGAAAVTEDAAFLAARLDAVGLAYFLAESGPDGGMHLWVPVRDPAVAGAPPALVRRIARAAAHHCRTLDTAPLLNPRAGCVRPPGAPHRAGGHSRLIAPDLATAVAYCDAATNTLAKLEHLAEELGAPPEEEQDQEDELTGGSGLIDADAVRLVGRRRPMSPSTAAALAQAPEGDASAHLARIFTGLALARWSAADVAELAEEQPDAPGLEHLRSQGSSKGRGRRRRSPEERRAVMDRQWRRCVTYAATLPRREQTTQDTPEVRALVATVAGIWQATQDAAWWRVQSGPSDCKALLFVAQMALEALADTVEVDCRRLADATGMTPSTASRALRRLIMDGRLTLATPGEGQRAHTYRLVPTQEWSATTVRTLPLVEDGTQATPRPRPHPVPTRDALLTAIRDRLSHAAHDLWTTTHLPRIPAQHHGQGLGRHLEATAAALSNAYLYDVDHLVQRTGHHPRTLARHLVTLARLDLADERPGGWRSRPDRYDDAARRLGTTGTRARRRRRYEAERTAYAAWLAELERLRAPRGSVRALFGTQSGPRYPRTHEGRPDHAAARRDAAQAAAA